MATKKKKKKVFPYMVRDMSKRYILGMDLSLKNSGFSVYDIKNESIIETLEVETKSSNKHAIRLRKIFKATKTVLDKYGKDNFVYLKETLPQQQGVFTTAATLQGLAKVHGLFEFYLLDIENIHSLSVKSKVLGTTRFPKGTDTKALVLAKVNRMYGLNIVSKDISDSVGVIYTYLIKYDEEVSTEIKRLIKKKKELKTDKAKSNIDIKIEELDLSRYKIKKINENN